MSENVNFNSLLTKEISGKKIQALQLVKTEPEIAAVISKLIKPRDTANFVGNRKTDYNDINQNQLLAISNATKSRIKDNEDITQIFPDIELAIQILVSSILSPKDMVKSDIIYKPKESILPAELTLKLTDVISRNFENYHHMKDDLGTILRETLFTSGSYVKAVIPESVVDEIINTHGKVSTESLNELFNSDNTSVSLGILGNSGTVSSKSKIAIERFRLSNEGVSYSQDIKVDNVPFGQGLIEVTDNFKLLKLPLLVKKHIEATVKDRFKNSTDRAKNTVAQENVKSKLNISEFSTMVYKGNNTETNLLVKLPSKYNVKRKSVGRPLVLRLPSESVIPVYVPGDKTKHIGYFVIVDMDGNPVSVDSQSQEADPLSGLSGLAANQNASSNSLQSTLIQKAKNNLVSKDNSNITISQLTKVYGNIIENDLMERLKNGIYGSELAIGGNEEIYRIMLSRALASKYTRLIYIPGEYVTYFAFKYYNNGVGKSYLDDLKVLTSLRAIMLFSKVMAQVKSSINLTHVGITLDPKDPDPEKTIEIAQHEVIKLRQNYFPLGINTPSDLVDWIQRAGLEFSYEGHPGLPETKFDFETKNLQHTVPDSDLDELLRKQTYMAFGLSPEVVDNGFNSEFATTVVSNNILLSKRVIMLQDVFTKQLTEFCHKLLMNDSVVIKEIKDVLKENMALVEKNLSEDEKIELKDNEDSFLRDIADAVIENIILELPRPDETSVENQTAAFEAYEGALDKTINYWVSSEIITSDITGDISSNMDAVKAILKAHFIRKWMADNNYMSELGEIVTTKEDGEPSLDVFDVNKTHIEGLIRSTLKFIKAMKPVQQASNLDLSNMGTAEGETSSDSGSDDSSDSGDMGGDDMGMGDMGMDMGGDDTEDDAADDAEESKDDETIPE